MPLMRLTRERYARLRGHGECPDIEIEPAPPAAPEPPPLTRGGEPKHPTWPRVIALVRNAAGTEVNWDFVTEAPRLSDAILMASRYPYRAIVVSKSGKREFDNGRAIEVEAT
jgi:hypothetical protein